MLMNLIIVEGILLFCSIRKKQEEVVYGRM